MPLSALNGAWTYSEDPSTSDLDTIRFLLGDTDPTDPLLPDAGINFLIDMWVDVYSAAAAGAEQIAGQFAREVANSGDGVAVDFSALQDKYMALAGQLRKMGKRLGRAAVPYVGGMSRAETRAAMADADTELTLFAIGMNDDTHEGASSSVDSRDLISDQRYGGATS